MTSFYVALYKAKLINKDINEIKISAILKIFRKLEKETKQEFREILDLSYLVIFEWKSTLFILLSGNKNIPRGWNSKIKMILEHYMNKIDIFYLTDSTYLDKRKERRLRSLGGGQSCCCFYVEGIPKQKKHKDYDEFY